MPRLHFRTKHVLPRIKPSRKDKYGFLQSVLLKGKKNKKGKHSHHEHSDHYRHSILSSVLQLVTGLLKHNEHQRGIEHRQRLLRQNDPTVRIEIKQEPGIKQEPVGSGIKRRRHIRK
jgi:hypothetical protein